ncbi:sensor histidine kinase [Glutamicibacter sp.]|uniref:sensor histidine kinase n=1 Tax=Glutamicibacter sp. TaxID=1931995 RepID=UPI002FE1970A
MSRCQPSALEDEQQFWNRWGWLMSGVWVVFLIFPILDLVNNPYPEPVRVAGLILVAVFAAVYLHAYAKYSWAVGQGGTKQIPALISFAVLILILLLAMIATGIGALSLIPFITSFAAFLLTRPWTIATYAGAVLICLLLPLLLGQFIDALFIIGLNFVLMVVYVITVAAITRAVAAEEMRADYLLVAEQERVARDVHDGIGHSLTALNLKAQLAMRLLDAQEYDRARTEMQQLSDLAVEALDSVRTTVQGLNRQDLEAELAELRRACQDNDLNFTVVGDPDSIPVRWRSHTAWILREALTNVLRHAHASSLRIVFDKAYVGIDDDGDGLGVSEAGHGIRGMQERAKQIGATATVEASALGGTRVQLTFDGSFQEVK